jgi:predicted DNA-binding WGR domain protein
MSRAKASGERRTYLELSDPEADTHKFYEVLVRGRLVVYRWGRIGTAPPREHQVHAESQKHAAGIALDKVRDKLRNGYSNATPGERKARPAPPDIDPRQLPLAMPRPRHTRGSS